MFVKRKSFLLIIIASMFFSCTKLEKVRLLQLTLTNHQSSKQTTEEITEQTKIVKEKVREAVNAIGLVLVRDNSKEKLRPRGSGVVVRANGIIATNYHVIQNGQTGELYPEIFFEINKNDSSVDFERYRLITIIVNKGQDLALLQVIKDEKDQASIGLPAITIETNPVEILDDIVIIGYPEKGGKSVTVNTGIVEGKDLLEEWIKTDARLIRGNSGGAAVNGSGKLIGIPTKIVVDSQEVDKDGDGFPDTTQSYGAVGFLRPAHLVTAMLGQLDKSSLTLDKPNTTKNSNIIQQVAPVNLVTIKGIVIKSGTNDEPIAGARIGLIPAETDEVTPKNLLCWGGSNADGWFELNKTVPPGKYCLKVKAFGFEPYTQTIEIKEKQEIIIIKLGKSGG
ncbi:MAG: trypsin-like peptidase domain-containing protein [Acidobacteria bacterium]|nr:trypsin-like peptidase domain-containing protein [Acidobacteriota bacterium]